MEKMGREKVTALLSPVLFASGIIGCNPLKSSVYDVGIWLIFVALAMILWSLNIIHVLTDRSNNVNNIFQVCIWSQIMAKLLCLGIYRKRINILIETIKFKFWLQSKDKAMLTTQARYFKLMNIFSRCYIIAIILISCLFLSEPALRDTRGHPFTLWLPIEQKLLLRSPTYEIVYFVQILLFACYIFCGSITANVLFGLVIGFEAMQLDLISLKLKTISKTINPEKAKALLKTCVIQQNIVTEFLNNINFVFRYVNLEELVRDIFYICFTIYMFLLEGNVFSIMLTIGTYLTLSQLCIMGEIATIQGFKIGDTAYSINWESRGDKILTANLQMIILRARRDIKLYASGFYELSLDTFIKVTKTALSFYVFLKQVTGKEIHK